MSSPAPFTVLHYVGYDDDRGGIVSVIRNLEAAGRFHCVLGVNAGAVQRRQPAQAALELPRLDGERISPVNLWRARAVAQAVREWLRGAPGRIYHGHSRAGLLVALWLHRWGERRVVVSVHCYGRQRWFYRWAARQLGSRLFWLSPAMKKYYRIGDDSWAQCIPGGVPLLATTRSPGAIGRLRLGGIGALVRWKGWHTVIQALALLSPEERARVTFTHIGGGAEDYRAELEKLVTGSGLSEQVTFAGEEPSPARLLGQVDALVVASADEPFSMAMLEALAAGVPVLAADSGGARDLIRAGFNGELYPTGAGEELTRLLRDWLVRPSEWPTEQIRRTTVTQEQVAVQWTEVYTTL